MIGTSDMQDQYDLSGNTTESIVGPTWHGMVTNLPRDWYRSFGLSFRSGNLPEFVGLTTLTGALLITDKNMWTITRRIYTTSQFVHEVGNYAVLVGDQRFQLSFVTALTAYGLVAGDKQAIRTASQSVEAVLASGVVVQLLKHITGRESPIATTRSRGRWKFFPLPGQYDKNVARYYAFPSGHISSTMALITVVSNNYPNEKWIQPVGYTVAGLVGAGLVAKGMHWYSDLPLGIALGYLFGNVVSRPEDLESIVARKETPLKLSIAPVVIDNSIALRLGVLF